MIVRHQRGYIYKVGIGKRASFHIRFYQTELVEGKPKRVQRSTRLCAADGLHYSTTCKAVLGLAEKHMTRVNDESGVVSTEDEKIVDFWDQKFLPYCETGYKGHGMKPTSVRVYKQIFDSILRPHFGETTLRQYKSEDARAFLNSMKTTRSQVNLRNIRAIASSIFTEAIDANLLKGIEINPWRIKLPTASKGEEPPRYTLEEAENIISALVDHVECQLAMALACFCGLRHGEIRGLQWNDIDDEWIHIRRQVDDLGNTSEASTSNWTCSC